MELPSHPDHYLPSRLTCLSVVANLINHIKSNGGNHSPKVTDSCTHLVTSKRDFDNPSPKGKPDIPYIQFTAWIVFLYFDLSWVFRSSSPRKQNVVGLFIVMHSIYISPTTFSSDLLDLPSSGFYANSASVKQAGDVSNLKIVSLEWLLDSVEAKKKVKETQYLVTNMPGSKDVSRGQKRARAESAEDDKPAPTSNDGNKQEPPAKKQKDGQKAKSRSIRIPIYEGCQFDRKYYSHHNASRLTSKLTHKVCSDSSGVH